MKMNEAKSVTWTKMAEIKTNPQGAIKKNIDSASIAQKGGFFNERL